MRACVTSDQAACGGDVVTGALAAQGRLRTRGASAWWTTQRRSTSMWTAEPADAAGAGTVG